MVIVLPRTEYLRGDAFEPAGNYLLHLSPYWVYGVEKGKVLVTEPTKLRGKKHPAGFEDENATTEQMAVNNGY
jgi:hypothetical protein